MEQDTIFATYLRCPTCTGQISHLENLHCTVCNMQFPCVNGIPILVKDPVSHQEHMTAAQAVSPMWYKDVQPLEESSPWRHHLRKRRKYVSAVIQKNIAKHPKDTPLRILDLGCGDGTNLRWLNEFSPSLWGSDYNLVRLARAKSWMPYVHIFLADILQYPAPDGMFNIIFFNHVIEHIPDDISALKEAYRILAPGGTLILGAPNEGCWWWQLAYKRAPEVLEGSDHIHFYTAPVLQARMENAGFYVSEVKHLGWGPPDWRLDAKIRKYKWVDDAFDFFGKHFFPSQASSLYLVGHKTPPLS